MFTKTRYFNPAFINSIEKDRTYHGHWWLPADPANKVSGVLYLKKSGGVMLHLIGMFVADSSDILGYKFADHDTILGELLPGTQPITLINCKERQRQSPYLGNATDGAVQRFNAEFAIFGFHFNKAEDALFTSFEFSSTYLVDWLNPNLFDFTHEGGSLVLKALPTNSFKCSIGNVEILFSSSVVSSHSEDVNFSKNVSISVSFRQGMTINKFQDHYQTPLIDLIQFGTSCLNSITFLNATPIGSTDAVKIFNTNSFDRIERSEIIYQYILFNYADIKNDFSSFLQSWFLFYEKSQHIFRLYFDSLNIGFQFSVSRFLNIVQAIESYHAEKNESQYIVQKKEEYKKNKALVVSLLEADSTLSEWAKIELTFFPTLRVRLKELLEGASEVMQPVINNADSFVSKVIDSRNYYTHYDPKKKLKAAFGLELEVIVYVLRILLNHQILLECNLEKTKYQKLITKSELFQLTQKIVRENNFWK